MVNTFPVRKSVTLNFYWSGSGGPSLIEHRFGLPVPGF